MTAIWLLSTRGRPDACQQVLDACTNSGMSSPGVVYVDDDKPAYKNLKLPRNWTVHHGTPWGSLGASMSWCFAEYPNADSYGWLADDTYPRTYGWDKDLEAAAGRWKLSYARDLWMSEDGATLATLQEGSDLSSGLCWGGDLIRAVGWWAPPGLVQAGIDTAWTELLGPVGLTAYTPEVIVEHKNWRTGKRARDAGDDWARGQDKYVERDIAARNKWVTSDAFLATLRILIQKSEVPLTQGYVTRMANRLADTLVNRYWSPGTPAARMTAIKERALASVPFVLNDLLTDYADPEQAGTLGPGYRLGPQANT